MFLFGFWVCVCFVCVVSFRKNIWFLRTCSQSTCLFNSKWLDYFRFLWLCNGRLFLALCFSMNSKWTNCVASMFCISYLFSFLISLSLFSIVKICQNDASVAYYTLTGKSCVIRLLLAVSSSAYWHIMASLALLFFVRKCYCVSC